MIAGIFSLSNAIRCVAFYRGGKLKMKVRVTTVDASNPESNRYEELLVNPTLIKLASQRGNIDCMVKGRHANRVAKQMRSKPWMTCLGRPRAERPVISRT
jgi:hypothetical protein